MSPRIECPNDCGSDRFMQKVVQSRSVVVSERGEVIRTDRVADPDIQEMQCEGCGSEVSADE